MYAKLQDGALIKAPKILQYNGYIYHNPQAAIYLANGYYPVVNTPYPEQEDDSKQYEAHYEQLENEIVQVWVEVVPEENIAEDILTNDEYVECGRPVEDDDQVVEPTEEELAKIREYALKTAIISKIREVYSIDDEIAILRQRESKPEEFQEYFNFVEQCKIEAKAAQNI